jgi:SPP1 family predicted phage head-tail adaptor
VPVAAGLLNNRITIRRPVEIDNGKGGYDTDWLPVATLWAEVRGLDGREVMIAQVLNGISAYRIRIRWRRGIEPNDQLRYDGKDLNIRSVSDPDGRRDWLVIIADTGSARTTEQ